MSSHLDKLEEMINSFPPDFKLIKEGLISLINQAKQDFDENWVPRERSITWGVDDFISRAQDAEERGETEGLTWQEYYDEEAFEEACIEMVRRHDANYGITWDSIDCALEDCKR